MSDILLTDYAIIPDNEVTTITQLSTVTVTVDQSWYMKIGKRASIESVSDQTLTSTTITTFGRAVASPSLAPSSSTSSHKVIATEAGSGVSSYFSAPLENSKSSDQTALILAISIPIGVIFLCLVFFSVWYLYFKRKDQNDYAGSFFPTSESKGRHVSSSSSTLNGSTSFKKQPFTTFKSSTIYTSSITDIEKNAGLNHTFDVGGVSKGTESDGRTFKDFGPVKVNRVNSPSNCIKSWFNRRSIQGIMYNADNSKFKVDPNHSDSSISTADSEQDYYTNDDYKLSEIHKIHSLNTENFPQATVNNETSRSVLQAQTPIYKRYSLKLSPFLLKSFKLLGGSNPKNSSQSVISGVSSPSSYVKKYIANKENILLPKFDIDEEYSSRVPITTSTKLNKPMISSPLAQTQSNTKSITAVSKSTTSSTDPFSDPVIIVPPQPQYLENPSHHQVPILSNLPTQLKLKKSQEKLHLHHRHN
ncbi:unnamed protein product [Ambrosiozyma monospora]|uniref:Unnamed protein product n=1 Tax=Ambrosiozyma monospora TaxID=43982 RepID=A0ACB5TD68_AMBMO|nr:unnamed protein product [Ambrosiozyma monospora]